MKKDSLKKEPDDDYSDQPEPYPYDRSDYGEEYEKDRKPAGIIEQSLDMAGIVFVLLMGVAFVFPTILPFSGSLVAAVQAATAAHATSVTVLAGVGAAAGYSGVCAAIVGVTTGIALSLDEMITGKSTDKKLPENTRSNVIEKQRGIERAITTERDKYLAEATEKGDINPYADSGLGTALMNAGKNKSTQEYKGR
ncbi:MAG: hypothetical protein WCJ33_01115 [Pseudomonadota bacterium]